MNEIEAGKDYTIYIYSRFLLQTRREGLIIGNRTKHQREKHSENLTGRVIR